MSSNPTSRTYSHSDVQHPQYDPPFVHALYQSDFGWSFNPYASPSPMLAYSQSTTPWNGQFHLFPSNPYPPPSPVAQKVWILDCKACDTFFTNRGMKAVLLLRPNVSLYSSDALPVNCSAYTSNHENSHFENLCPPSLSPPACSCECLTQTLRCHGCGAAIGYMIVIPCARCTSPANATRATNGHRFVFHSHKIVATERRFVYNEPGIIPCDPGNVITASEHSMLYQGSGYLLQPESSPGSTMSDNLPTPPLELADPARVSRTSDAFPFPPDSATRDIYAPRLRNFDHLQPRFAYSPLQNYRMVGGSRTSSEISETTGPSPSPSRHANDAGERKDQRLPHKLQPGDVLYWHHLSRSGEVPGVVDNERSRGRMLSPVETISSDRKVIASLSFNR